MTSPAWPEADLEYLGGCPLCSGEARAMRFEGLEDKAFRAAGGRWTLYDCSTCGAAYLDPRPTPSSIGRAYERYYTHEVHSADEAQYVWRQKDLKSRLKVDYLNKEYGYRLGGAIAGGNLLIRSWHRVRLLLDYSIRHLPAPRSPSAKLLDVGCGNGSFLSIARSLGYHAVGIDPDPKAADAGRAAGLDIRVSLLPDSEFEPGEFEHITMSHVFEHLHRPRESLERCYELLEPGGRVWISQPNLDALGLREFGSDWRGLEAPRHLTLHNFNSLSRVLSSAGFSDVRMLQAEEAALFFYRQSALMKANCDPYGTADVEPSVLRAAEAANRAARKRSMLGENITITAKRV